MAIIYKAINKINNKIYIGQTTKKLQLRAEEHRRESIYSYKNLKRKMTFFHFAILEYGFENFIFTQIEECKKEELDEKEKYWIKYYKSDNPNYGYNMTEGGQDIFNNNYKKKNLNKILKYDVAGNFIEEYENVKVAAKENNISESAIRAVYYKEGRTCGGFQWRKENSNIPISATKSYLKKEQEKIKNQKRQDREKKKYEKEERLKKQKDKIKNNSNKNSKIRVQIYLDNKLLSEYERVTDAAKDLNISISRLSHIFKEGGHYKDFYIKRIK